MKLEQVNPALDDADGLAQVGANEPNARRGGRAGPGGELTDPLQGVNR